MSFTREKWENYSGHQRPNNKSGTKQKNTDSKVIVKKERPTTTKLTREILNERWRLEAEAAARGQPIVKTLEEIQEEKEALYIWKLQDEALQNNLKLS
jgi:hypothetical protein